ncbi:hypothetical protein AQUCO_12000012v1 [Aquilegia coerulea]|uniref:Uncharacterized protein n=1 Tax=Aquilegia coerulea TaxID=218851 RepID=A0A2G5C1V8_AQUCA|nr:hypothetical protein AQUCO_12000012v1 [Aquilegia coerulea]
MAKKRSMEDDNTIYAKRTKHLIAHKGGCVDEAVTNLLSKEEQKLFFLDRWFRPKSYRRTRTAKDIACMKDFFTCALNFIRQAYHSIRGTGNEDIVEVLKDKVAMLALIDFATCLRRMKEYLITHECNQDRLGDEVQN